MDILVNYSGDIKQLLNQQQHVQQVLNPYNNPFQPPPRMQNKKDDQKSHNKAS
jgi:hypothetical protein